MGIFRSTNLNAIVNFNDHKIVFQNSWKLFPLKSKATLELDGVLLAESNEITHLNPHIPLFDLEDVAPDIDSLQVFFIGVFSVKACIFVNGEEVYRDKISGIDKLQARVFEN
jgi:hypothetical protein